MNRKRKISGLMSLILLLAMLDGAFFPQILRLMPDTENSWQLSAALLRVTMQDLSLIHIFRTVVKHRLVCLITVGCIFVTVCVLAKDSNK